MSYLYILKNRDNNKKFLGKSNLEENILKKLLFRSLRKGKHYNKLLQKEFKKNFFEFEIVETDDVIKDFDEMIKKESLLNPMYGYNVFNDLQNRKGRHKKKQVFTEDLCLLYLFNPDVQFWSNVLGLERNTISNRIGNFDLFDDGYYYKSIARYEDYYWTALRILYLEEKCMTATQLIDRMMNRFDISSQLRITPRKVSKFFSSNGVKRQDKRDKGSLIFCPNCDKCEKDDK